MPRKKKIPPDDPEQLVTGVLHLHPRGFGFVTPDPSSFLSQDVFIPRTGIGQALDSDLVEVTLAPERKWEKGPEGVISEILKRGRSRVAGTVMQMLENGDLLIHIPVFGTAKPLLIPHTKKNSYRIGDRVVAEIKSWPEKNKAARGVIKELIGNISNPSCDVIAAMKEYDIAESFPKNALEEIAAIGPSVDKKDLKGREDLTGSLVFTIDPETARDFDDALSLTKDSKGNYHLGVHIADVSHYVRQGTALDKEAKRRSNSTYFPGTCIPMLPRELSDELCSLKPKVIRLTISVFMTFDPQGELLSYEIKRSYIQSAERFTYEQAKRVLDGEEKSPHLTTLKLMVDLCRLLKKMRAERGSIDFSIPELVILIDEKGVPYSLKTVEYDITHQLVEEFMLKANEMVATYLSEKGINLLFRIHEEPTLENMQEFYSLARLLGFTLPPDPTQEELQKLFDLAKTTPFGKQLSSMFIRMMKMAFYSPENVGHYGLKLENYCHFTSPIRRYSDLVVHRLLFEEPLPMQELKAIALIASQKERVSMRAENSVKLLKRLRYLQSITAKEPAKIFTGYITKVMGYGFFFEIVDLGLEGFLHVSDLHMDFFTFNPKRNILVGRATGLSYFVGLEIEVTLDSIDLILQESFWSLAQNHRKKKK
jgi:ribonuclease R